eukprot:symbB.v1.2.001262.t1/scaffold65.1/size366479/9
MPCGGVASVLHCSKEAGGGQQQLLICIKVCFDPCTWSPDLSDATRTRRTAPQLCWLQGRASYVADCKVSSPGKLRFGRLLNATVNTPGYRTRDVSHGCPGKDTKASELIWTSSQCKQAMQAAFLAGKRCVAIRLHLASRHCSESGDKKRTVARFSTWICNERVNPMSEQVLRSVLQQLLTRVLDKNKRVQEAACSAFATLEEMARHLMVPYLSDIVQTLSKAFQYYQAKNLLILYDAVGTLADSVGPELDTPTYKQQLLEPLFQKFNNTPDNDRSIIALFECLSSLASNLGPSFLPLCKPLVERCTRLIINGAQAAQMWMQKSQ